MLRSRAPGTIERTTPRGNGDLDKGVMPTVEPIPPPGTRITGARARETPARYARLRRGRYVFEVRAVNPGGEDATRAKRRFRI